MTFVDPCNDLCKRLAIAALVVRAKRLETTQMSICTGPGTETVVRLHAEALGGWKQRKLFVD